MRSPPHLTPPYAPPPRSGDDDGDVELGVATSTNAGTVDGAGNVVQTVSAGRRTGGMQQTVGGDSDKPVAAAPGAHVIEDDDEFGLDEDLGEVRPLSQGGRCASAPQQQLTRPPSPHRTRMTMTRQVQSLLPP